MINLTRYLLLFFSILFSVSQIHCQSKNSEIEFHFGINSFSARGNSVVDKYYKQRNSYNYGIGLKHSFYEAISVVSLIQMENCRMDIIDSTFPSSEPTGQLDFKYINIPLLFELDIGNNPYAYFRTGINFGLLIAESISTFDQDGTSFDFSTTSLANHNIGFYTGIGGSITVINDLDAFLEFNNNLGITNIVFNLEPGDNFKTNSIRIIFGLRYSIF